MKKIINKILRRNTEPLSNRITTETVAEHRERILAGGRRFKYPIQYAKHKLVINAIIISIVALVLVTIIGWYFIYIAQGHGEFVYSVTKVLPVPIANVDGRMAKYSDYLMEYRGFIYYYENKEQLDINSEDGKRQLDYLKRQTLDGVIADTFARKLADEMDISISDEELEASLSSQRKVGNSEISAQTYDTSALKYFDWTSSEYRHLLANRLLRQKVAYALDDAALSTINEVYSKIEANKTINFSELANSIEVISGEKPTYGASGWVPMTNKDGGLADVASKLTKGQVSSIVQSNDGSGYYVTRLIESSSNQVSYEYIKVALSVFDKSLQSIKDQGKVQEYVDVD